MNKQIKNLAAAFLAGFVFAAGLGISGMTQPGKIISFLNVTGSWDPSLAFVMMGAILVHSLAFHLWLKRSKKPLFAAKFSLPTRKDLDLRLLLGAGLFGIGWGLSGFCPGPALMSIVSLQASVLIFTASMIAGMVLFHYYERLRQAK